MSAGRDQASSLRNLLGPRPVRVLPVFGARGRAQAVVNLAAALAATGNSVLVVDASRGEIAPAFDLPARYELKHVMDGDKRCTDVALEAPCGVRVLPAARGIREHAHAGKSGLQLFEGIVAGCTGYDIVIVNAEKTLASALELPGNGEAMIVVKSGPEAVTTTLDVLKGVAHCYANFRALLVNGDAPDMEETSACVSSIARSRLNVNVTVGGSVPTDALLRQSQAARRTIFDIDPASPAARAYRRIAEGAAQWKLATVQAPRGLPGHRNH